MTDSPFVPAVGAVPEVIAWWARATPDAPALLDLDGEVVSYSELQRRIDRFGRVLAKRGIGRKDRVVLALPDGLAAPIAAFSTIRVAIAVPVNPAQSPPEAALVLAAVQPSVVVVPEMSDSPYRAAALAAGIELLPVAASGQMLASDSSWAADARRAPADPDPDDTALILLTSGTTDRPRLAPASHRQFLATCAARVESRRLARSDRGISSAPAYFVIGLARVAESLLGGGSAVVAGAWEIVQRPEHVRDLAPTWAWFSPALLETLLDRAVAPAGIRSWPLRFVRAGGAQVTPELIARCQALLGVPLLNGYGTTETLGYIAAEESPETVPRRTGSVGLARAQVEIAIRDEQGQALPGGESGEITVRGSMVFSGYLGDAEATAAAFFPDGWYRTGDLGYLDGEGYLFVTGRSREMINRGSEKIAPREIDEVLREHPAISDAAAFGLPDARLGEEIVTAVVLRDGQAVTSRALRLWLAKRVSLHKVPRKFWFLRELPRTGSGKIQRGVLRERFRA